MDFTTTKSSMASCGEDDVAADEVVDHRRPVVGDPEPQRPALALEAPVAAEAVVAGGGVALGAGVDLLAGAVAGVERARPPTACRWRPGSASVRSDWRNGPSSGSMPSHASDDEDAVDPLLAVALGVGVLDAQDEGAAGVAGEEPVEQRRPGAADVEEPRGRRGEADPAAGRGGAGGLAGAATGATRPRRA